MASCTAIEECESSFASPCSQVGCLHESTTTEYDNREQRSILYTSPSTKQRSSPTAFLSESATDLREAIADATARTEQRRAKIKEWSSESVKTNLSEREKAQEAFQAYKRDVKAREKLKACERGVMRLLERCEGMLEGKPGFEPVVWRRSA